MRFHTLTVLGLSVAILAACGGPTTVTYRLTFDTQDPTSVEELTKAAIRVAERRLERLDATLSEKNIVKDAEGVTLTLGVSDGESANILTEEMTSDFTFDIMETTTASGADVTVEGLGGFLRTDVNGDDIVSIVAAPSPGGQGALVRIKFTEEGLEQMRALFGTNVGKDLGLFVNDRLVSTMRVLDANFPTPLIIDGIPDIELAQIFADDVNVGLNVTVTPL